MERVGYDSEIAALHARMASASGNPFLHPAWVLGHARRLESEAELTTWLVSDPSGPLGLALLCLQPDGTVRFAADRMSDVTGAACSPDDTSTVLGVLADGFDQIVPIGARFRAGPLPAGEAGSFPGWLRTGADASPTVEIAGCSWHEYVDGPGARRRRRIAAQADRLITSGRAEVFAATTPEGVKGEIDVLATLHRARFGRRSRTFSEERVGFFRHALPAMARDGIVVLRTLELDGRPAATILVFRAGDGDWFYQSGWDPALAHLGVGRALFAYSVRQAFIEGRSAFRMLRGQEEYKSFWANGLHPVVTFERSRG